MEGKIKVYCDHGVFPGWLKSLEKEGVVEILYCRYEIHNKKIKKIGTYSAVFYDEPGISYNEPNLSYNSSGSEKFYQIEKIIGKNNDIDIKHLDAAYKSKCHCFITSDKKHFFPNKDSLEKLLSLKIYYQSEEERFLRDFKIYEFL